MRNRKLCKVNRFGFGEKLRFKKAKKRNSQKSIEHYFLQNIMFDNFNFLIGLVIIFTICVICYLYVVKSVCKMEENLTNLKNTKNAKKLETAENTKTTKTIETTKTTEKFMKSKGDTLFELEEDYQIMAKPDLLIGDLGFKVSNKINGKRENDQFYFNPNIANCNNSNTALNCPKPIYGQEFAEGWFV